MRFWDQRSLITTDDCKRRPKMNVNYEIFARLTVDFHGSAIMSAFNILTGVSFRAVGWRLNCAINVDQIIYRMLLLDFP